MRCRFFCVISTVCCVLSVGCDDAVSITKKKCITGESQKCYINLNPELDGVGICSAGLEHCVNDVWTGVCEGEVIPELGKDRCGVDSNCNGIIDIFSFREKGQYCSSEILEQTCVDGPESCPGECRYGKYVGCSIGTDADGIRTGHLVCSGEKLPSQTDVCDGKDNDCDGEVDEPEVGITLIPCYDLGFDDETFGRGVCRPGFKSCLNGNLSECLGQQLPVVETCNSLDDDCDGETDEGLEAPELDVLFVLDTSCSFTNQLAAAKQAIINLTCSDLINCPTIELTTRFYRFSLILVGTTGDPPWVVAGDLTDRESFRQQQVPVIDAVLSGGVERYYDVIWYAMNPTFQMTWRQYPAKKLIVLMGDEPGDVTPTSASQIEIKQFADANDFTIIVFNGQENYYRFNTMVGCKDVMRTSCQNYREHTTDVNAIFNALKGICVK